MVLMMYKDNGAHTLWHRAGKLLDNVRSAFEAELLALEWSLSFFMQLNGCFAARIADIM